MPPITTCKFYILSLHCNGNKLRFSPSRHLSLLIQSGIHTDFALDGKKQLASQFSFTYRYIDDVLCINKSEFDNFMDQMYSVALGINDTTESNISASYPTCPSRKEKIEFSDTESTFMRYNCILWNIFGLRETEFNF